MARLEIDLNPITVEIEIQDCDPAKRYDQGRYVVYLYDERVKTGEWVDYPYMSLDTDDIRTEYTALYQKFLTKRFREYLGFE